MEETNPTAPGRPRRSFDSAHKLHVARKACIAQGGFEAGGRNYGSRRLMQAVDVKVVAA